jgi:1-aminocyclopropane-1-carboxylate deaminase/D-cysteine desulfhydrase-like pyridoxal-dependent ACC family enzyme
MFGNKIRYIEFIFGLYKKLGYDCVLHAGGITSNYMAQLAMAGAACQIPVYILIRGKKPSLLQGNTLLDELFAQKVVYFETDEPTNTGIKKKYAEELKKQGLNPLIIDYPVGNFYAYLGYMKAYYELKKQQEQKVCPFFNNIFLCSGFHSYLGLKIAADLFNDPVEITAFRASKWEDTGLSKMFPDINVFLKTKVDEFSEFLNVRLLSHRFNLTDEFVGNGYAIPDPLTFDTILQLSRAEGILLDPVYTGKAFTGLIHYIRNGKIPRDSKVLFIHTGGLINNFTFSDSFTRYLNSIN